MLTSCSTELDPEAKAALPSPARGKVLYNYYCAGCHGTTGVGHGPEDPEIFKQAPNLTIFVQDNSSREIRKKILSGSFFGMPEHRSRMVEQEMYDVISYLQLLSEE